jgi:hypothetical protein
MLLRSILITAIVLLLMIQIIRKRAIIRQLTPKERIIALLSSCSLFAVMIIGYHFLDRWVQIVGVSDFIRGVVFFVYCFIVICVIAVLLEKMLPKKLLYALINREHRH